MSHKIDQPIVGYKVVTEGNTPIIIANEPKVIKETLVDRKRPEVLLGSTYKLKIPIDDTNIYITINDILINEGTEFEERRPYEIFINSKNMQHYQWVIALTRIISLIFRSIDKVELLVEELKSVFDPHGGYHKGKGVFVNSIVADIGLTIEKHLKIIGYLKDNMDENMREYIESKKKQYEELHKDKAMLKEENTGFPANATLCNKCGAKAVLKLDNCSTCINCSASSCG